MFIEYYDSLLVMWNEATFGFEFFKNLAIVIALVITSGMFSGLTIGLTSLSISEIKKAMKLGDQFAEKVLKIKADNNLLLVTLLLGNTAVNATIAIFLGALVGEGIVAGIVSTIIILIFGEIIPASVISQRPLKFGAMLSPIVNLLLIVLYPLTFLLAKGLDKWVGKEGFVFITRRELEHYIEEVNDHIDSELDDFDKKTLKGAISLSEKIVGDHMSTNIFYLDDILITKTIVDSIKDSGFTRTPIIVNGICMGILNTKRFLNYDFSLNKNTSDIMKSDRILNISDKAKLDDVIHHMINNKIHIAMVKSYEKIVGVITMEDIIEELLGREIEDEYSCLQRSNERLRK